MKRRLLALTSVALCLSVSISAGWLWKTLAGKKFEASARLALVSAPVAALEDDKPAANEAGAEAAIIDEAAPIDEARVLSPEVLSAAAVLIADRNVPLALASPFDSVTDYLLERTRVGRAQRGGPDDIRITCSATSADEALQMLSAIVDAYLDAATTVRPARADLTKDELQAVAMQTECEQLAAAIEQHQQTIAELAARLEAAQAAPAGTLGPDPITLEAELVQARRASGDAAACLAAAQYDIEKKMPAEFVAARIVDLPARTRVLERLSQAKIKDDLDQQEALRQKWSAIYGRNHPRMAEIRQHIESLEQQVALFSVGEQGQPAGELPASGAAIVLAALQAETTGLKSAEQELETRLASAQQRLQQQQELETKLSESRQELEFLHGEHGLLWKQIDGARREQASRLATLIEPPALAADPIAPQAGLPMAVACVSGMALCLLVLWQFRTGTLESAATADAPAGNELQSPRKRFRSHEEEQLMRLKLQSAR